MIILETAPEQMLILVYCTYLKTVHLLVKYLC